MGIQIFKELHKEKTCAIFITIHNNRYEGIAIATPRIIIR